MMTTHIYYKAMMLTGNGYLYSNKGTLAEIKHEIDRVNARAVRMGYQAEKYNIVRESITTEYEGERFVRREILEEAIGIYPDA